MWTPGILWMHVIADILIAMAYFHDPVRAPARGAHAGVTCRSTGCWCRFGIFIVSCGLTHVMEVWNVWHTDYWLKAFIKVITAAAFGADGHSVVALVASDSFGAESAPAARCE